MPDAIIPSINVEVKGAGLKVDVKGLEAIEALNILALAMETVKKGILKESECNIVVPGGRGLKPV